MLRSGMIDAAFAGAAECTLTTTGVAAFDRVGATSRKTEAVPQPFDKERDGLVMGEGTVYPILSRFRTQGLVEATLEESPDGPARKYYRLTPLGKKCLIDMNEAWDRIHLGVLKLRGDAT